MTYSGKQKALVAAAVERYGEIAGLRLVAESFNLQPSRATVHAWIREQGLEPTAEARAEVGELERQRKAAWQATIDARRDSTFDAFDAACKARNYLGMQQAATAVGILYDKLVPPRKAGVSVNASGEGQTVQLLVVAPSDGKARPVVDSDLPRNPATT